MPWTFETVFWECDESILLFPTSAVFAHPGGGIIALSENSAIIADSVQNLIWPVEKG